MDIPNWFRYHFKISAPPSRRGSVVDASFICPQAFGRSTWTDKEIGDVMREIIFEVGSTNLSLRQDEAFNSLKSKDFNPGNVNVSLAIECKRLGKILKSAGKSPWIIGQWEVIYALAKWESELARWYDANRKFIIAIWPPLSGEYLMTRGMLFEARKIASLYGLTKILVVGHKEHLARCALLADSVFGSDNVILSGQPSPSYGEVQFDPSSMQKQTVSKGAWRIYEIMARFHHMVKGWTP